MAEWLVAHDIGQTRAALVDGGRLLAARIARDSDGLPAGALVTARLIDRRAGIARSDGGEEIFLGKAHADWPSEGAACCIAIRRPAIPERGLVKRAMGTIIAESAPVMPTLTDSLAESPFPWREDANALDEAGWDDLTEEARTGLVVFEEGMLRIDLTAAMTVIDVDGPVADTGLPLGAAVAAAMTLHRLDIGGNVVIDFPAMADRSMRQAVDKAFDAAYGHYLERTATNGYGLLQIIVPRVRQSLIERWRFAPVESAALDLLRHATRARGAGTLTLTAAPSVISWLNQQQSMLDRLARAQGRSVTLHVDDRLGIAGGHAQ